MAVTIRPLTLDDPINEVGDVYVQSWRSCYAGLLPDSFLQKLTPDRWSGMLHAEPDASLVLIEDGRIVGTAMAVYARAPQREGYGELISLYLRPSVMGRGYGRMLLTAALQKLRADGCENACLWVLSQNKGAIGFYTHMGFSPSGQKQHERFGEAEMELSELCMPLRN